ncbi:hypothetical protein F5Y16DRAFT_299657 [Xylariaceae sp. FL0255]|nr:hypothetical protein F5Y16DRAFT_299657 [Xylariaceae sp. FL0255]
MHNYSDLEVVPSERQGILINGHTYPESNKASPVPISAEYAGHAVSDDKGNEASLPEWTSGTQKSRRRKCGLPPRIFYTVLVITILLILGAIAGGVAGGVTSRSGKQNTTSPATPSPTMPPSTTGGNQTSISNVNILAGSKISATNWTDPNGFTHRYVFFQDPSAALIVRIWDSQNQTWATTNLTSIIQSQSSTALGPLAPSPLASAAFYYEGNGDSSNVVHVYYINTENYISSVLAGDLVGMSNDWVIGSIEESPIATQPGSQLATAWNRCSGVDCTTGTWALAYQRSYDGAVTVVNSSDFSQQTVVVESNQVAQNSSLAMVAEVDLSPSPGLTSLSLISEHLQSSSSGVVDQTRFLTGGEWASAGNVLTSASLPPPSASLQFAIAPLENFLSPLFLALLPEGSVTGYLWNNDEQGFNGISSLEFRDSPNATANFSAIAASEEPMIYGVVNDTILSFSINASDLTNIYMEFVEQVYP